MTIPRPRAEAVVLLAIACGWIVLLYSGFHTLIQGDSGGYLAPGCMLWGPYDVSLYDGARTPLYPLFLTALEHAWSGKCLIEPAHGTLDFISAVQLALYLAALVHLYRTLAGLGAVVRVVGVAAVAFSPLHALFARQILTEALGAPLALVFLAHVLRFALGGRSWRDAALAFASFTLVVLTRPNLLVPLAPAVALVLWLGPDRRRSLVLALVAIALPLLVLASLNAENHGYFTLTNLGGFSKTHIVYNVFDRVHEEDAVLGSILSRQHALDVKSGAADGQVIWRAMPEVRASIDRMPYAKQGPTQAGTSDLNAYLGRVSSYLIRENPGVVLANTGRTLLEYLELGALTIPEGTGDPVAPGHAANVASATAYALFVAAQSVQDAVVRAALVLLPVLLALGLRRGARRRLALPSVLYAVYVLNLAMVSLFNVVQHRYVAVLQPFLLLGVCVAVQELLAARGDARSPASPPALAPTK